MLQVGAFRGRVCNLIVRTNDERFESAPRIETEAESGGPAAGVVGFLYFRRPQIIFVIGFRRAKKSDRARRADGTDDGGLQGRHVITFYPELVNVVGNAKRQRILSRIG